MLLLDKKMKFDSSITLSYHRLADQLFTIRILKMKKTNPWTHGSWNASKRTGQNNPDIEPDPCLDFYPDPIPWTTYDKKSDSWQNKIVKTSKSDPLITDKGIVVVGNVDAGKSTLIGTLISGTLDNGRGSAREKVAKHQHEIISGKTSDISTRILKFPDGKTATLIDLCGHEKYFTTTASGIAGRYPDYAIVVVSPTRGILPMTKQHFKMLMSYSIPVLFVVTRVDMALEQSCEIVDRQITALCKTYKRVVEFMNGYKKYHAYRRGRELVNQHNIVTGDRGAGPDDDAQPDQAQAQAAQAQAQAAQAQAAQAQAAQAQAAQAQAAQAQDILEFQNFEINKMISVNRINQGLGLSAGKQNYIPVIYVSNVDGYWLDVVKQAIMTIEPRDLWNKDENSNTIIKFFRNKLALPGSSMQDEHVGSTYYIDGAYNVKGVGLVVSGINRGDPIGINDDMLLGPVSVAPGTHAPAAKTFIKIKLKSMHNDNRQDVTELAEHHRGCIAIKLLNDSIKKNQIKKGMVMISNPRMIKNVCFRFDAAITIFGDHAATLRTGYSPVIHAGTIKQAAKLILHNNSLPGPGPATLPGPGPATLPGPGPATLPSPGLQGDETHSHVLLANHEHKPTVQRKIKSGDVERVSFKFRIRPEYLEPGTVFVFRSGDIHGVGAVISVLALEQDQDPYPEPIKRKFRKIRPCTLVREKDSHAKKSEKIFVK
jgi:GTPase